MSYTLMDYVVHCIRKDIPDYEYSLDDFTLREIDGTVQICDLKLDVNLDLEKVKKMDMKNFKKKKNNEEKLKDLIESLESRIKALEDKVDQFE